MNAVVSGSALVARIYQILHQQNKNRNEMCRDLSMSTGTISGWISRNTIPAGNICIIIADYLGVSVKWLVTGTTESQPAPELAQLFRDIAELDAEGLDTIKAVVEVQKKYRK